MFGGEETGSSLALLMFSLVALVFSQLAIANSRPRLAVTSLAVGSIFMSGYFAVLYSEADGV